MKKNVQEGVPHPFASLPCVPGFMTVKEAAGIIGVSTCSVYGYIQRGKLSAVRVCGVIVVRIDDVYAYAHQRTSASAMMIPGTIEAYRTNRN